MLCKQIDAGGPVGKACSDIMKKGLQNINTEMNSSYSHPNSHECGMASMPTLSSDQKNTHIERDLHPVPRLKKGNMQNPYLVRAMQLKNLCWSPKNQLYPCQHQTYIVQKYWMHKMKRQVVKSQNCSKHT